MINLKSLSNIINQIISIEKRVLRDLSSLLVFYGFDSLSHDMPVKHLLNGTKIELIKLNDRKYKKDLINIAVENSNNIDIYYCSYEEYLILDSTLLQTLFEIKHLSYNIYNKILPLNINIDPKCLIEKNISEDLASEFLLPLYFENQLQDQLDNKIGQVYSFDGQMYYVPIVSPECDCINLPECKNQETIDFKYLTITEDEGSWIALLEMLKTIPINQGVKITFSNSILLSTYQTKVKNLNRYVLNEIDVLAEENKATSEKNDDIYNLLNEYWDKKQFRYFQVYKNVRVGDNFSIVSVSQENVICDILTQVNNAQKGKPYRDIFVTAPTGTGKSLMFQLPAIQLHNNNLLTLVISPLIALMNDQIQSLESKRLSIAATINSSITLIDKVNIIEKIKDGSISILYLSPESLLSRSDVSLLIGDRIIGLLVVDEAHIVTTWGKAFRPDYWYLGNYIQKLRRTQAFPIATFTATAIYKGPEDMYSETRDSLGMRDPITYFGFVPRKNIAISFEASEKAANTNSREYNEVKYSVLTTRLEEIKGKGKKVLVYFPFVSLIDNYIFYLSTHETGIKVDELCIYYGSMLSTEKKLNFEKYKENQSRIMLATKAFGMGIDIPDIDIVYHFAPTGNVCDYIQEIGRAARDENIKGIAKFDYLKKDFSFVNKLHGISTMTKLQLIKVMKKIYNIGTSFGNKRNLLISSDDFQNIFLDELKHNDRESENLDNKIKTALLIIEKDLIMKLGYSPIVARPRALFTFGYFRMNDEKECYDRVFGKTIEYHKTGCKINLKQFWEEKYPKLSFAKFKYEFYNDQHKFGLPSEKSLIPQLIISINENKDSGFDGEYFIKTIINLCAEYNQSGKYFKEQNVANIVAQNLNIRDKIFTIMIAESILSFLTTWNRSIELNVGRFLTFREDLGYRIISTGYADIKDFYYRFKNQFLSNDSVILIDNISENKKHVIRLYAILGLLDTSQLLTYSVKGGDNPEIFVRVNSYYHLRNISSDYKGYENIILNNVKLRHEISVKVLDYLFKTTSDDSEYFWEIIQDYFLGKLPDFDDNIKI
ncbi:MAG: ATP-dependent DNA helicase RecQ [Ignavibacteriales bacterium]|nr:ATP-dependent DNA helicase RecQ [Ignavibacteriales bacterium]